MRWSVWWYSLNSEYYERYQPTGCHNKQNRLKCYYNKTIKKCVQASAFLSMNFSIRIQDDMYMYTLCIYKGQSQWWIQRPLNKLPYNNSGLSHFKSKIIMHSSIIKKWLPLIQCNKIPHPPLSERVSAFRRKSLCQTSPYFVQSALYH